MAEDLFAEHLSGMALLRKDSDMPTAPAIPLELPPTCDFNDLLATLLQTFGDNGDPQMCVALLLVFGKDFFPAVDISLQTVWFHAYCELLNSFQLWNERTAIIRLAHIRDINDLNTDSTSVHTSCGACSKPLVKAGWFCTERCKEVAGWLIEQVGFSFHFCFHSRLVAQSMELTGYTQAFATCATNQCAGCMSGARSVT